MSGVTDAAARLRRIPPNADQSAHARRAVPVVPGRTFNPPPRRL